MKYRVDVVRIRENYITLNGWAIGRNPGSEATRHTAPCRLNWCGLVGTM